LFLFGDGKVKSKGRIVTIGLAPAWDVSCRGKDLDWGRHLDIDEQVVRPAGKALNISSALAWMGCASVASGLWGRDDFEAMRTTVQGWGPFVRVDMTAIDGSTRRNITVVDTKGRREMHLRCPNYLATPASLTHFNGNLRRTVCPDDTCVFAGAMPAGDLIDSSVALVESCRRQGGEIVVDTYGPVLKRLVDAGLPSHVAPNVEELGELLGAPVKDTPAKLVAAARTLLEKVPTILISRGSKGAIVVTQESVWAGRTTTRGKVLETVGCGDCLLAGFLAGYRQSNNLRTALAHALTVATARAWGLTETKTWSVARKQIDVEVAKS
jgi:1-phosphofructokinase family hexose kinase